MKKLFRKAGTVALLAAWYLTGGGCGGVKIGPFFPPDPEPCLADPDCPVGFECRFPAVDTHAICIPVVGVEGEWPGSP